MVVGRKDIVLVLSFDDKGTAKVKQVTAAVKTELDKTGKSAQKMGKDFNGMRNQVENSTQGMGRMKKALKSTWAQMVMGLGVMTGISGAMRMMSRGISNVMKTGREFERTWANVTTMINDADVNIDKFRKRLVQMSPILGSTIDLGKGLYQVLSASITPAEDGATAIKFLGVAAKAAQAGLTDTFTAVDALTTVINAYRMPVEDATKVSDIMFKTVMRGKLVYEGLASTLGTVVPIAAQVGIKFEEVAAAIATLTRQGIAVNTTTVQLRQIMVSVLKPTAEAEKAAKRLGVSFDAATLKSMGLAKFLEYVTKAVKGDAEAMTEFFGNVRALTGVFGLAGKAAVAFGKDLEFMKEDIAATEIAFRKQMASADFWMKTLKNVFEKLRLAIYDGLTEPFKEGIKDSKNMEERIKELTRKLTDFGTTIGTTIGKSIKLVGKLKDTLIKLAVIMTAVFAVKKILAWKAAFTLAMVASSASATVFGGVMTAVGTAISVALLPALAVLATALAALAFGRWISNVTGLTKAMYKGAGAMTEWGKTGKDSMYWQQKLKDQMKDTGISIAWLRERYGDYKTASEKMAQVDEGWFKTLREKVKLQSDEGVALLKTIEIYKTMAKSGKWSAERIKEEFKSIEEMVEEMGIEMPKDLKKIRDEGVKQVEAANKVKKAWEGVLRGFRNQVPTVEGLKHTYKGLNEVMEEMQVEGWASDDVLLKFKGTITDLWKKAQPIIHLMGKEWVEAMQADIDRLKELSSKTDKVALSLTKLSQAEKAQKIITDQMRAAHEMLGISMEEDLTAKAEKLLSSYKYLVASGRLYKKDVKEQAIVLVTLVTALEAAGMSVDEFAEKFKAAKKVLKLDPTPLENFQEKLGNLSSFVMNVVGQWDTLMSQYTQNQLQRIDNEYQKKKEAIDASMMSDQEKYFAIEKLEREKEKQILKAQRKQAIAQKMSNLMGAIVNTARAVAEALPNIPKAIIVGAMGAAQIALIAATPLPTFAKGGIAWEPQVAMLAEKGPEVIRPLEEDRKLTARARDVREVRAEFNAHFHISSPDTMGWQRITREKIAPEFVEWVRLNKSELLEAMEMA